jgi:hypothetical protein
VERVEALRMIREGGGSGEQLIILQFKIAHQHDLPSLVNSNTPFPRIVRELPLRAQRRTSAEIINKVSASVIIPTEHCSWVDTHRNLLQCQRTRSSCSEYLLNYRPHLYPSRQSVNPNIRFESKKPVMPSLQCRGSPSEFVVLQQ